MNANENSLLKGFFIPNFPTRTNDKKYKSKRFLLISYKLYYRPSTNRNFHSHLSPYVLKFLDQRLETSIYGEVIELAFTRPVYLEIVISTKAAIWKTPNWQIARDYHAF